MADFDYIYQDPTGSYQIVGSTPHGLYDQDTAFQTDGANVCKFVSRRLGHPVMQIEIDSGSIYAMFEEAVSEYSLLINQYNMKNWLWDQYSNDEKQASGSLSTGSFQPRHGNMGTAVILSEQYGEAAGVGGNATLHSGSITLSASKQQYDLDIWSMDSGSHGPETFDTSSDRIVIQKVYNQLPASTTRFYDPYVGTYDQRMMLDQFGFASYSPATTFILRPISYDLTRAHMIETSDYLRKSNYSFEIVNNKIKLFPEPTTSDDGNQVWFEYYVRSDANATTETYTDGKVSDPSNAPYQFITYNSINAPGRQWIKKYTLALSKELLGIIRSKYASMPLPNGEVTMDGDALKAEGREEKSQAVEELKEFLESVTLSERARQEQEQAEANQAVLNKSPLGIFIG